jgi:hypothetical protein
MGIEMKKTKTRRPSWRRAMSVQRRCAKQLIPLAGSKPATQAPPRLLVLGWSPLLADEEPTDLIEGCFGFFSGGLRVRSRWRA